MPPKSGYSRAKAIDYDDDDDFYESDTYEEGDDAGDDGVDKEQMRVGTSRVREILGDMSSFVTDSQIEEALWHYYYDVEKSVTYLKNKLQPATPEPKQKTTTPKAKAASRFDQAASAAQEKTPTATGSSSKKKSATPNGNKLAQSIESLAVDDVKVSSKNINVVEAYKNSNMKRIASFVVIGHVDHGKSTLMGRLLYDLKIVDQRSMNRLKEEAEVMGKSSFALAWVMDSTSEERSRGVTADIATNYFQTDKTYFTILDAPGHKDFVPNMISGATQADFPILVVDASIDSFEAGLKGQTREHIRIARSLGLQSIIVAVNKMDNVQWSKSRFDEISQRLKAALAEVSIAEKHIHFVPVAGLTGENVVHTLENPLADWYTGDTLLQSLERIEPLPRDITKPFRLSVADVFRGDDQSPLCVTGRIDTGNLQVGDTLSVQPSSEKSTVRAIEFQDEIVDWAVAGQIVTIHLRGIDRIHLQRGSLLCAPSDPVRLVKSFVAKLLAFDNVLPQPMQVFRGQMDSAGAVKSLNARLNKFSGEVLSVRPKVLMPGQVARGVISLEKELPVEAGMRVVLRERGRVVACGVMENMA